MTSPLVLSALRPALHELKNRMEGNFGSFRAVCGTLLVLTVSGSPSDESSGTSEPEAGRR
jgi:hypothetical protein